MGAGGAKWVGFFTALGAVAAVLVVPEVRKFLGLKPTTAIQVVHHPESLIRVESPAPSAVPALAPLRLPHATDRQRRLAEFSSLVSSSGADQPGSARFSLLIDSSGTDAGFSLDESLSGHLSRSGIRLTTGLFRGDLFRSQGFFEDLYQGDGELLRLAMQRSRLDFLILAKMHHSFRESQIDSDLISCDLNMACKLVNRGGLIVGSDSFSVSGPGFTRTNALQSAVERAAAQLNERMLRDIRH